MYCDGVVISGSRLMVDYRHRDEVPQKEHIEVLWQELDIEYAFGVDLDTFTGRMVTGVQEWHSHERLDHSFDISEVRTSKWHQFKMRLISAMRPPEGWHGRWMSSVTGFHVSFQSPGAGDFGPPWDPKRYRPSIALPRGRIQHHETKTRTGLKAQEFRISCEDARLLFERELSGSKVILTASI